MAERITIQISPVTRDQLSYLRDTVAEAHGVDPTKYEDEDIIALCIDRTARELLTAMVSIEAQGLVETVKEELRKEYGEDVDLRVAVINMPDVEPQDGDLEA